MQDLSTWAERNRSRPGAVVGKWVEQLGICEAFLPLVIFLHLCITVPLAANLNIWVDEACTLQATERGMEYAIEQSHSERQPPLYYGLLSLWRKLDKSLFFTRLFSIMCIILTILIVAKLSLAVFKDVHPAWLAFLLALNPYAIWAAIEARGYALVILLSALVTLTFFRTYLVDGQKTSWRWGYGIVSALAIYGYYMLAFLLVANAVSLAILRRWHALRMYVHDMAIVAVVSVPILPYILTLVPEVFETTEGGETPLSWLYALKFIKWRIQHQLLSADWPPLHVWQDWIWSLGPVVTVGVAIIRRRSFFTAENLSIFMMLLISCLGFAGIFYGTKGYLEYRHTASLLVPALLAVFVVIAHMWNWKSILAWTCVALVFNVSSLYVTYEPMSKDGDWNRVATYIREHGNERIPILVFVSSVELPFRYAYSGANPIVPIPKLPGDEGMEKSSNGILHSEAEIVGTISALPAGEERVWLVTWHTCGYRGKNFNCEIVEEFVRKYAVVEQERAFRGTRARLLRLKEMPVAGLRRSEVG